MPLSHTVLRLADVAAARFAGIVHAAAVSSPVVPTSDAAAPSGITALSHPLAERAKALLQVAPGRFFDTIRQRFSDAPVAADEPAKKIDKTSVPIEKTAPTASEPASSEKAPVDGAAPVAPSGGLSPKRKKTIILNAVLGKLLELNKNESSFNLIILSHKGEASFIHVKNPSDGSVDPVTFFATGVMEQEPSAVSRITGANFSGMRAQLPDDEQMLGNLAIGLMKELGIDLIVGDGEGHFIPIKMEEGVSKGTSPLKWFQEKYMGGATPRSGAAATGEDSPAANAFKVEDREYSYREILESFDGLFLRADVMNRAWKAVGLRDIITNRKKNILEMHAKGEIKLPNGAIFNGPQGVGKSATMEDIALAWARSGGYVHKLSLGKMEERYVGSFANNLIQQFEHASQEAKKRGKPALIIIDEATNLVTGVANSESAARYYQGALDVLKDYATSHPELIFVLATNARNADLDGPLTRSMRLDLVTFGLPDDEQRGKMFAHYLKANGVVEGLDAGQIHKLVVALPDSMGADIRKFAEEYYDRVISREYAARGLRTEPEITLYLEEGGAPITRTDVKDKITFESILAEFKDFAATLRDNKVGPKEVGFR